MQLGLKLQRAVQLEDRSLGLPELQQSGGPVVPDQCVVRAHLERERKSGQRIVEFSRGAQDLGQISQRLDVAWGLLQHATKALFCAVESTRGVRLASAIEQGLHFPLQHGWILAWRCCLSE